MSVPNFLQVHGNASVSDLQGNLVSWIAKLKLLPFLGGNDLVSELDSHGNPLDGISFTAATQKAVAHKLGKVPKKVFPTRFLTGGATWFESATADATYVYLKFSANCKVYLRVE